MITVTALIVIMSLGCSFRTSIGNWCGRGPEAVRVWSFSLLQKPKIVVVCPDGSTVTYSNQSDFEDLSNMMEKEKKGKRDGSH